MENVEVLQVFPPDTLAEVENLKIHQRIRLTSFDSGFYEIPPMMFYIRSDQWIDSLESNPIYLLVHSVAVDSTIYDVKVPIHMPVSFLEVFPFVMGGLVIAAGIFFLVNTFLATLGHDWIWSYLMPIGILAVTLFTRSGRSLGVDAYLLKRFGERSFWFW